MRAAGALLILLCALVPVPGEAQGRASAVAQDLQRADAAYAAGDRALAQKLYRSVLASDPDNARALFQLARLLPPGSDEAVALLRRYVALEPRDAWGYMALGDALARAGATDEAVAQYDRARSMRPAEPDVYTGLGRILRDAGRNDALVTNYEEWTARQPGDAQAWTELGRARQRAKRYVEAADAYARAYALKQDDATLERIDAARAESSFSFRPFFGMSNDSDENRVTRWGFEGDWQLTERSRLGLRAERIEASDPFSSGTVDALAAIWKWQPLSKLRLDGLAGAAELRAVPSGSSAQKPVAGLRVRWNPPQEEPAAELRVTKYPLASTPGLVAQPVELTEAKAGVDVPVTGPFRVRARAQGGSLVAPADNNHRVGYQLGPVYRFQPAVEAGVFYSRLDYDHDAAAGYFAPRRAEVVELGVYAEYERLWPLTFAVDAGAGQQRVQKQGEDIRNWIATYRLWGMVSYAVKPGVSVDLEVEHYDSPVAGTAVAPVANWTYNAALLSLRFGVSTQDTRAYLAERAGRVSMPAR